MRRVKLGIRSVAVVTGLCLIFAIPSLVSADDSSGTVRRSWISQTSGGPAVSIVQVSSPKRIFANFTWETPPSPGQELQIQWRDPAGVLRAEWTNQTIGSDHSGTRLFAWIAAARLKASPGRWHVVLLVGGVTRSSRAFRATTGTGTGMSLRDRLTRAAIAQTPAIWKGKTRYTLRIGKRFPKYASVLAYPAPGYEDVVQEAIMIFKRSGDDWINVTVGDSFGCSQLPAGVFRDIGVGCAA